MSEQEFGLDDPTDNFSEINPRRLAERAFVVFEHEGWSYYDGPVTVDRLEQTIVGLIDTVVMEAEPCVAVATGRIVVEKEQDDGFTEWKVYLDLLDPSDRAE